MKTVEAREWLAEPGLREICSLEEKGTKQLIEDLYKAGAKAVGVVKKYDMGYGDESTDMLEVICKPSAEGDILMELMKRGPDETWRVEKTRNRAVFRTWWD